MKALATRVGRHRSKQRSQARRVIGADRSKRQTARVAIAFDGKVNGLQWGRGVAHHGLLK
jgi:hypothetical protein